MVLNEKSVTLIPRAFPRSLARATRHRVAVNVCRRATVW